MEKNDSVIEISNKDRWENSTWHMMVDLQAVADNAGVRVQDNYHGGFYGDYPVQRAKKLLKLIKEYGSPEDLEKVGKYVKSNARLAAYWKKLTEGAKA